MTKQEYQTQLKEKLSGKYGSLTRTDILFIINNYTKTKKGLETFLEELELKDEDISRIIGDFESY